MIFHMCARSNLLLRKGHLAAWRAWRSWKLQHSSGVCASSGPGPQDRSEDLSSVSTEKPLHTPVMLKEVLHFLDIQPGQVRDIESNASVSQWRDWKELTTALRFFKSKSIPITVVLDMTFGGGGHTKAILSTVPGVTIVALDRDPTAVSLAQQLAEKHDGRVKPVLGRFSELEALLSDMNIKPGSIDGVLLDAGCSSMQMDRAERGFSLSRDGPLDMRMDGERYPDMPCAADVVNTLDQQALASILAAYGEERHARKIASAIVEARRVSPITRTQQLASVVAGSFPAAVVYARKDRLHRRAHVATKTFQALRILVNDELNEVHAGLRAAREALRPGGRLCVVTFHSLEDRLVKRFLQGDDLSNLDRYHFSPRKQSARREKLVDETRNRENVSWLPLRRKVIVPDKDDVQENPRGRSAKLRAAVKP